MTTRRDDPGPRPTRRTVLRSAVALTAAGGLTSLELVEINPTLDVNNRTVESGVELILSALGKTIL